MKRRPFGSDPGGDSSGPSGSGTSSAVSRRTFLQSLGTTAVSAATLGAQGVTKGLEEANAERVLGPGPVRVTLMVNGERRELALEPRTTLLEALRMYAGITGPKESCDRASCGACTVLLGDRAVYACAMLAIETQGVEITTVEGLARSGELTRLQKAFVDKDGLQCGFCTPGMVITLAALIRRNPHPTEDEIRRAIAGNLCRCGSQPRIIAAAREATGGQVAQTLHVLKLHDHGLA